MALDMSNAKPINIHQLKNQFRSRSCTKKLAKKNDNKNFSLVLTTSIHKTEEFKSEFMTVMRGFHFLRIQAKIWYLDLLSWPPSLSTAFIKQR
jgi:hypothetical protein